MKPTPSRQYQSLSMTRALGSTLPSSVSSSAGPTGALKSNRLPSGDQTGLEAPCCMKVSWLASPPSVGISHIWGLPLPCCFCSFSLLPVASPSRSETKASQRPSGDQVGLLVLAGPAVKRFASPPSLGTTQIEERYSYLRSSMVVTTKATRCPSGEIRGLATNLNRYRSSIVILRRSEDIDIFLCMNSIGEVLTA